jgi:hypothetical protein
MSNYYTETDNEETARQQWTASHSDQVKRNEWTASHQDQVKRDALAAQQATFVNVVGQSYRTTQAQGTKRSLQAVALDHQHGYPPGTDYQRKTETYDAYVARMKAQGFPPDINVGESDVAYKARLAKYIAKTEPQLPKTTERKVNESEVDYQNRLATLAKKPAPVAKKPAAPVKHPLASYTEETPQYSTDWSKTSTWSEERQ